MVSQTGGGKSTLAQLLVRLADPDSGTVRIGGIDLRHAHPTSLRRAVSIVFQESFLFSGTVADNIRLGRPDADRADVEARYGGYYAGDGATYAISGNVGLPLTSNGFFNFSFEYGESDATDRSIQRDDAAALIAAGNTDVKDPAQVWGSPEIQDDLKTFINWGVDLNETLEVYGHANYVSKTAIGGFYFRNPNTRAAVFSDQLGAGRPCHEVDSR